MSNFICPIKSNKGGSTVRLTSPFGWRKNPFGSNRVWHQGVDLSITPNTNVEVVASADGEVIRTGELGTYGYVVMIKHNINNMRMDTNYAHLKAGSIKVKVGQKVKQGQVIGIMGSSGASTAPHLHFEIHNGAWLKNQPNAVDVMNYISLNSPTQYKPKDYSKSIGYSISPDAKAFRIHSGAFASKQLAEKARIDFVKNGYLRYAEVFGNDKNGYRLQSGKYTNQKDAEDASKKMLDAELISYASIIGTKE